MADGWSATPIYTDMAKLTKQPRQAPGTPDGGQWRQKHKDEQTTSLAAPPPDGGTRPVLTARNSGSTTDASTAKTARLSPGQTGPRNFGSMASGPTHQLRPNSRRPYRWT